MLPLILFLVRPWRWYPWYRQPRSLGRRIWWRVGWTFAVSGVAVGATFVYRDEILLWFFAPAEDLLSPFGGKPIFTEPTGMLTLVLKMMFYGAVLAAIPAASIGSYHLARSKLSSRQRRWVMGVGVSLALLYAAGVMFVYYVILPNGVPFLLNFGGDVVVAVVSVTAYMSLALTLMFWMGLFFQAPLLMFAATKARFISYRRFKATWKFVPWITIVLGVFISPGVDPVNALLVAIPLSLLYQLGLFCSWLARPEEGNYLWMKTVRNGTLWLWHLPCRIYWKLWRLATAPFRKLWRLIRP